MGDSPRNQRKPAGLIFCAFFTFAAIACAGTYSGGSGTAEDPYRISTVADWQELIGTSVDWDKLFILINDIDFGGITLTPIAPDTQGDPSGYQGIPFTGSLDGNGHLLMNLKIGKIEDFYIGPIGCVGSGGQIRNLGIENATMIGIYSVGGLIGVNYGTIDSCYATDSVSVSCVMYCAGGLAGINYGTVSSCYANSIISGTGSYNGGLIGDNQGTITDCFATGTVDGGYSGGLVGSNSGTISGCYASGAVSDFWSNGGLVGVNGGTITDCFATGIVNGTGDSVGGLVADNYGTIRACFSTGAVSGTGNDVGGLVGRNDGPITACYATGAVSGTGDGIGGLVGNNWNGTIDACYAIGAVSDTRKNVGGLVGMNDKGIVNGSFWDTQTTGQTVSAGGTGMTTPQMKTLSYYKFAGWADKGWVMQNNIDYPRLSWENTEGDRDSSGGVFLCGKRRIRGSVPTFYGHRLAGPDRQRGWLVSEVLYPDQRY